MEPFIAQTLRNYLSRVGHRSSPVQCTQNQIDDLNKEGLLHIDTAGNVRFEGQVLAVYNDDTAARRQVVEREDKGKVNCRLSV